MSPRQWYERFISPSRVDEYLQFMSGIKYNFGDMPPYETAEFIDNLLKIEDPTKKQSANAGSACHSMLENAAYGILENSTIIDENNMQWQINTECDVEIYLPYIRESWVGANLANCNILGKVDGLDGYSVYDHKFTKQIEIDKYINSTQWKMYLLMTERNRFVYNLFQVKIDDFTVTIKDYQQLVLYAYPQMEQEITQIIADYKDLLFALKPMLIERLNEYNSLINEEIVRFTNSPIITAKTGVIQILKTKLIKIDGLN